MLWRPCCSTPALSLVGHDAVAAVPLDAGTISRRHRLLSAVPLTASAISPQPRCSGGDYARHPHHLLLANPLDDGTVSPRPRCCGGRCLSSTRRRHHLSSAPSLVGHYARRRHRPSSAPALVRTVPRRHHLSSAILFDTGSVFPRPKCCGSRAARCPHRLSSASVLWQPFCLTPAPSLFGHDAVSAVPLVLKQNQLNCTEKNDSLTSTPCPRLSPGRRTSTDRCPVLLSSPYCSTPVRRCPRLGTAEG